MGENSSSEPQERDEEAEMAARVPPVAREFFPELRDYSRDEHDWNLHVNLVGMVGAVLGGVLGVWLLRMAGVTGDLAHILSLAGLFLGGGFAWWLFSRISPRPKTSVLVGIDGAQVRSIFVPYSDVEEVILEGREYEGNPYAAEHGLDGSPAYMVDLYLARRGKAKLHVKMFEYPPSAAATAIDQTRQTPLVRAIEEGLAAWRARQETADLTGEELMARGESTPREWLTRLRALGSGANATYRAPAVSRDTLSRLLTNPAARPSTRAAAALVLKASDEDPSHKQVRIGSTAFADTKLRVAIDDLDAASDDEAILEALQGIEAAENRVWAPPNDEAPPTS